MELDLETYAGRTIYIFTNKCDQFYTKITIQELIDYEHPEARLVASDNGAVEYIEGKGWHAYSANGTGAYYVAIPGNVVMHYINNGYTSLKLSVVNNLNIGIATVGSVRSGLRKMAATRIPSTLRIRRMISRKGLRCTSR